MPQTSRLFTPKNILGPPLGIPTWILLPPLSLSNPFTWPGIHAASRGYRESLSRLIIATGWCLRWLSYQLAIFLEHSHAILLLTDSIQISCLICIVCRVLYQIWLIPGCQTVYFRKVARSSGIRTVTFLCTRIVVPISSSHMKCTCGTVQDLLPP